MTSYALLLHGQLRKGSCVCGQYLILCIYGMLRMRVEGITWSYGGIASSTLSRCGQLTVGVFPAWGGWGVGGGPDCRYVFKILRRILEFGASLAHVR